MGQVQAGKSNILVLHRDPLVGAGLIAALCGQPSFEVLSGDLATLRHAGPRIDVVVADQPNGMSLADPRARRSNPRIAKARVMIVTPTEREVDIRRAVEAGVHGYLVLGGPLSDLVDAVGLVAQGARYLCPTVARCVAESLSHESLTSREIEVLQLVVAGESNKAIARCLRIQPATVKSHVAAILSKLGAASRTQAAGIATRRGLFADEPVPAHMLEMRRAIRNGSSAQPA